MTFLQFFAVIRKNNYPVYGFSVIFFLMETNEVQQQLFSYLKENLPPHLSVVDELCDLLDLSADSVYRRDCRASGFDSRDDTCGTDRRDGRITGKECRASDARRVGRTALGRDRRTAGICVGNGEGIV